MGTSKDKKDKPVEKLVGPAIIALRACIRALQAPDCKDQEAQEHLRYDIANDRSQARIYDPTIARQEPAPSKWPHSSDNQVIANTQKSLEEYAEMGRPIRLAKIGLLEWKLALEEQANKQGKTLHVRYSYNAFTGEAGLSCRGKPVVELPQDNSQTAIPAPTTIESWSQLGRQVERRLFEALKVARDYGREEAAADIHAQMVARGVIRDS